MWFPCAVISSQSDQHCPPETVARGSFPKKRFAVIAEEGMLGVKLKNAYCSICANEENRHIL
jgi:hypothetical protein